MIATAIFLLLFLLLISVRYWRARVSYSLFFICLVSILLLFWPHATDKLNINL